MILKDFKDGCRLKHTMSLDAVQKKYDELKARIEQLKAKVSTDAPNLLEKNTLFSMKKFALMRQAEIQPRDDDTHKSGDVLLPECNLLLKEAAETTSNSLRI